LVRKKNCLVAAQANVMLTSVIVVIVVSVAMNEYRGDTPEQVRTEGTAAELWLSGGRDRTNHRGKDPKGR
jgi:hypothetical protein